MAGLGCAVSCLDGVPFKIGPMFLPPQKSVLPAHLDQTNQRHSALQTQYSFEVEEGVLRWSRERKRQLEAQKREEEERAERALQRDSEASSSSESDTQEDATAVTQPGACTSTEQSTEEQSALPSSHSNKPLPSVPVPNPLLVNISNGILTPTPISQAHSRQRSSEKQHQSAADLDISLFEKQDDPFDNLELQTINDMEELRNVLDGPTTSSPSTQSQTVGDQGFGMAESHLGSAVTNAASKNGPDAQTGLTGGSAPPIYENVQIKPPAPLPVSNKRDTSPIDTSPLPPVPKRRGLVKKIMDKSTPLPPIGGSAVCDLTDKEPHVLDTQPTSSQNQCPNSSQNGFAQNVIDGGPMEEDPPTYDNVVATNWVPPVPSRRNVPVPNKYSRHSPEPETMYVNMQQTADGGLSVGFRNAKSTPDLTRSERTEVDVASPRLRSPPPRPSSQQSWNRYSPLPPPPTLSAVSPTVSRKSSSEDTAGTDSHLSTEARTSINNLVSMGFSRPRVSRAVEELGEDEKEVVEFLCLVDQLTDKGYEVSTAETALFLFHNNLNKAEEYLALFQQFRELGFGPDKIKEALVASENDRDKALDLLTA